MPDLERLLNAIDRAEENSYSSDEKGDLADERSRNIDNYLGKNTFPAPEGRSQVMDRSVYETVQWMIPSLCRIFANGDDVVNVAPVGPEDEQGAKQESQYLNYIVLQKNNWYETFRTAALDALITKAGYLHPYVEKRRQVEIEKYERQTPESLAMILEDQPEIISQNEYPDPDYIPTPQPVPDPMTGQPAMGPDGQPIMVVPPPPMLYDIEIRRTKVEKNHCILVLPPERCKIAQTTKTVQLNDCPYFEFYDFPTISDLRADGYTLDGKPIPDDLGADDEDDTVEGASRDQYYEDDEENPVDPSMRRVKCRWVWIKHDYDEDGIAELQFVVVVGRNVLHREEVNRIPVAVICPNPLPHRHIGLCPADDTYDIQQINTVILRQGLDNLQLANNPQKFGDPSKVNLDDMMVSRPGGITRTRNGAIFGQDFGVYQVPDIFPSAMNGLEYMDHVRQKRTGVNYSFQGLDAGQLSQLQPGTVNQVSSMSAQQVEQVARNIANGVVEMFAILHEQVLKAGHKKDTIKLRGKWVEVDPSTWRSRSDFRSSVGYSAGNKDSQMARLMGIANLQKEALAGGLRIVTEENAFNTAIEITKAGDFANPDAFWTDPASLPPPQPPQPDPTVMAMETLKAQSADNVKRMDVEQKERDSQRDAELKKYEIDVDAQVKLALANAQAQQAKELEAQKGEQAAGIEHIRATLNPKTVEANAKQSEVKQKDTMIQMFMESQERQTQAIGAMFEQMLKAVQAMNGPKRIVRDKAGRAVGTEAVQ